MIPKQASPNLLALHTRKGPSGWGRVPTNKGSPAERSRIADLLVKLLGQVRKPNVVHGSSRD
jgi:hypothetical protein